MIFVENHNKDFKKRQKFEILRISLQLTAYYLHGFCIFDLLITSESEKLKKKHIFWIINFKSEFHNFEA
jgi:hypothetical protein